jgi:hypothetical protein
MRYQIVHIQPTDYEPSNDRDALEALAEDLNRDAIADSQVDRWIVVMQAVVGDLFGSTETRQIQ